MSVKSIDSLVVLNQTYTRLKKQVDGFNASTDKNTVQKTLEELQETLSKINQAIKQNPQAAMRFVLASNNIPKLVDRCKQLLPAAQKTESQQTSSVPQIANAQPSHNPETTASAKKTHKTFSKFDTLKKFNERGLTNASQIDFNPSKLAPAITEIKVKCKVPSNHALYIRGEGASLDWSKGVQLKKIDEETYVYCFEGHTSKVSYKILLDDTQWEQGNNHVSEPGKAQEVIPNLTMPVITARIVVNVNAKPEDIPYIRGTGPGLSWDKGVKLNFEDGKWVYETTKEFKNFEFKIVLNDTQWENGENHKIESGNSQEISVRF